MAIRRPLSLRGVICRGNLIIFSLFLLASSFFAAPAFATATVTAVRNEVISGQGILPNSPATALLRVQVTFASGDTLTSIAAAVINYSGLSSGEISRLSIYQDNYDGVFSSADSEVAFQASPVVPGTAYTLSFSDAAYGRRTDNTWWYFIVVKTSDSIDHADAFQGWLGAVNGTPSGTSGSYYGSTSNVVRCECKVVDIFYTESFDLSSYGLGNNEYEEYWKPNYLSYAISQEMTEPNETNPAGTHLYYLSQARRYSYLTGSEDSLNYKAAYSNFLKFERRRKLMGMNVLTPVLGIKVAGKNQYQDATYYDNDYFDTMVITFVDTNYPDTANFDPETMLFAIQPYYETSSGVAIYQDTNGNGLFDEGTDQVLCIDSFAWSDWSDVDTKTLTLNFSSQSSNPQAVIPQVFDADYDASIPPEPQDRHDATGVDFFVVLRARPEYAGDLVINYGADFTAQVTGMSFCAAKPLPDNSLWYETREIKAVYELSDYTGTRVDPNSTFPVIGINVNDGGLFETLNRFNLYLKKDGTNFDPSVDLTSSGVTVLNRSGSAVPLDIPGGWSEVTYQSAQWWKTTVNFSPTVAIPDDDTSVDSAGPDYFINLTTTSNFGYNKKIIASIPDNEFIFGTNRPSANGTALTTNANLSLTTDPSFPHGSNQWVYPDIDPADPKNNPVLGNPLVVFSQINNSVAANSGPIKIIGIDLADNTSEDTVLLKSVVVQVVDTTSGGFAPSDLKPMSVDSAVSGIGLYDSAGPRELSFPPSADFSNPAEDYRRYLLVLKDPLVVPQSLDGTPELYITLNTSSTISSTDAVIVRIWGSEIKPCSSYGLGFRAKDATGADTVAETNQGTYSAYGATVFDQDTLTLSSALPGFSSDYTENWYLVITAGGDNAVGRIYKVTDTDLTRVDVDGIDLTKIGLGSTGAVKFFKVESTSYRNTNNSFGVNSTGSGGGIPTETVTLGGVSNSTAIVLTWIDGTHGDSTVGFKIERRNLGDTLWTEIESALMSGNPKLVIIGPYTYQYTDTTGLEMNHIYEYKVTVLDGGGAVSNIISVFFSAFFRKPQNLDWSAGILTVELSWDWPDGNRVESGYWEDGFFVERKRASDPDSAYAVVGVAHAAHANDVFGSYTDRAFTDSMLRETVYYSYRVRAYRGSGSERVYSDYSNTVTAEVISSLGGSGTSTGGCFIATAAFGTPLAKEVVALKQFRDRFLLTQGWGRAFVRFYYRHSPPMADYIRPRPIYCSLVRSMLRPLVWLVKAIS